MDEMKKMRKPGRTVFFEDTDRDEENREENMEEIKKGRADEMASGSKAQLQMLLGVLRAVKKGDFSARFQIEEDSGIMSKIAEALNDVIGLNENLAKEIVRVSNVVGEEGSLTERASLGTVSGYWATSVNSINALINNLAQPTTEVGRVITAVAEGNLSRKMLLEIEGNRSRVNSYALEQG